MKQEMQEIVDGVACEMLARSTATTPPPSDLEAERFVVAGLLCGSSLEFVTLKRSDFYAPLLGVVYELASLLRAEGLRVSVEPILVALRDQGWSGPVEEELLRLRDEIPSVSQSDLETRAAGVAELSTRRRLLALCEDVAAGLRSGSSLAVDALIRLRGAGSDG